MDKLIFQINIHKTPDFKKIATSSKSCNKLFCRNFKYSWTFTSMYPGLTSKKTNINQNELQFKINKIKLIFIKFKLAF